MATHPLLTLPDPALNALVQFLDFVDLMCLRLACERLNRIYLRFRSGLALREELLLALDAKIRERPGRQVGSSHHHDLTYAPHWRGT
jgi:hypothetical protein